MANKALQAYQLSAATSALTSNFGPGRATIGGASYTTPQQEFADSLMSGAQAGIQTENAKEAARKAKKKNKGIGSLIGAAGAIAAAPFTGGASLAYIPTAMAAGGAAESAISGDVGGAVQQGAGALQSGYATAYPQSYAVPQTAPAAAAPAPVTTPQQPLVSATDLPPMTLGQPQAAPAASMPVQATPQPAASGTAGPLASGYVPLALGAGAAALGTRFLQNHNTPSGAEVVQNSIRNDTGSSVQPNSVLAMRRAGLIDSVQKMSRRDLNTPKGAIQAQLYADTLKEFGQKMPVEQFNKMPQQVKQQLRKNPAYQAILPSRGQMFFYNALPIAAALGGGAAAGYATSSLTPAPDGVLDYNPGG